MKMSDLNNLNLENIGSWPAPVKIAGAILVATLIIGIGWWQDIDPLQQKLAGEQKKEGDLKIAFEGKQKKAANLPALKQQLEDIKETFGDLLKRLPNKTEVAELLVDISQQGLGAGLEFDLFKPGNEQPADFYVELPIEIRVIGTYHQFGTFISGISDLPRIVTSHDIKITPTTGGRLILQTTAKTYRYIDEEGEGS
ncbi:MAG: type 4a pilus biogenesis protein PilO [Proteobacteria bacterium]|jgi:type IV pilus assembly protein PilO|nr:type 4a pilus biogenesis protein PilO [Pseudomonadota bacterium]MBK8958157.1 type 4a pilus biogenesis protein PilO [Pseudomonadota bacterium]